MVVDHVMVLVVVIGLLRLIVLIAVIFRGHI